MVINQGDCVRLRLDERTYQVIAIDNLHNRCWLRPWPLQEKNTPVFEEDLGNVMVGLACPIPEHHQHQTRIVDAHG